MAFFDYQGKKIYYRIDGEGVPCLFLHGNTASSTMFDFLLPFYIDTFQVIRIDFLGNGRSERVTRFSDDLWQEQGRQVVALCETLGLRGVHLVGTSGGAYAAINAALMQPALFGRVVADSFDGQTLAPGFAEALLQERAAAKADEAARGFYEWNQGEDWEKVVDQDTDALLRLAKSGAPLFYAPIASIQLPLLITISRADEMLGNDMEQECRALSARNPRICYAIFDSGVHPLILSQAEAMAARIKAFLEP